MQSKFLALCAVAVLVANPGSAQAQVGNGGATYSDVNNKNQWSEFMPKFVTATLVSIEAQGRLMTAVGLSAQATALDNQAKDLSRTTPANLIEDLMTARSANSKMLRAKVAAGGINLDAATKQQFGEGIDFLARAIKQYDELSEDLPGLKLQMRGAGEKARNGLFVAKSITGYVKEAREELAVALAFATANNIPYPAESSAVLKP
ncbi:MAG: hypothetical protein ACJ8GW_15850 [Massilia sp.]